jgi:hypothetical protein
MKEYMLYIRKYVPSACIEVRLIKTNENETGLVYPTM